MKVNKLSRWEVFAFITFLFFVFLRFVNLDERPMHHDESLHAQYSKYNFLNFTTSHYKYDPLLHGPFLYLLNIISYWIFGVDNWSARILMPVLASLILFSLFYLREHLTKLAFWTMLLALSLSPNFFYWSRFIRHDLIVIFSLLWIVFLSLFSKNYKASFFFIPILLSIILVTKEIFFIVISFFVGLTLFDLIVSKIKQEKPLISYISALLRTHWIYLSLGSVIALVFSFLVLTSFFHHPEGFLDALYRKSLNYWSTQHSKERISGPFSFQSLIISWYDFPVVLIFITTISHIIFSNIKNHLIFIFFFLISLLSFLYNDLPNWMIQFLKFKIPLDLFLFLNFIFLAIYLFFYFYKDKKMMILSFLAFSNLFTYSFVGERVPWLSLYPQIFILIFCVFYWSKNIESKKILIPMLLLVFINSALIKRTSFEFHYNELINQVHTTKLYDSVGRRLKGYLNQKDAPIRPKVLLLRDNSWPMSWYLYDLDNKVRYRSDLHTERFDYIFTSQDDKALRERLKETHNATKIPLRNWWSPLYHRLNLKNFFNFLIFRKNWNPVGSHKVKLLYKKSININVLLDNNQ